MPKRQQELRPPHDEQYFHIYFKRSIRWMGLVDFQMKAFKGALNDTINGKGCYV